MLLNTLKIIKSLIKNLQYLYSIVGSNLDQNGFLILIGQKLKIIPVSKQRYNIFRLKRQES